MKQTTKIGDRIKGIRLGLDMTQVQFAEMLHVTQPMVSAWEGGLGEPSLEACVNLAKLGGYRDALFFLERAGIDRHTLLSVAEKVLKELGKQPPPAEIVRVAFSSGGPEEGERPPILFAAKLVPNPLSTRGLIIDEKLATPVFPVGDLILLDESAKWPEDRQIFWGEIVLVHLTRPEDKSSGRMAELWKEGLNIGKFLCRPSHGQQNLHYVATLGPFDDADKFYRFDERLIVVGSWTHEARGKYTGTEADAHLLKEAQQQAKLQAPMRVELTPGCRMLGRVIGWFRSAEKLTEKEKGK